MQHLQIVSFREAEHGALVEPLTAILHLAYGALLKRGMRYHASHQPSHVTLERLLAGEGFLAFHEGRLIGTVTLYGENPRSRCEHYRRPGVFSFGQFAIHPEFQGAGFGSQLMDDIERRAAQRGAQELALDTSERADDLIARYSRRGYAFVGYVQHDITNYRSVVMSKRLEPFGHLEQIHVGANRPVGPVPGEMIPHE